MIGLRSDKQCKRRWSLKNPDQKGSFKFQQEGPQWVCDMVRLWSDLGTIKQCLHQRHRLRRRPLLPLHPSLSRQLAGWWHDAGGAADDDGDAILMMMLTWWIWHYVGARAPSRQFFPQKFWIKSESTPVFLSKNLSLERKIATNHNSRQKYAFRTNIEFSKKCIYLQLKPI